MQDLKSTLSKWKGVAEGARSDSVSESVSHPHPWNGNVTASTALGLLKEIRNPMNPTLEGLTTGAKGVFGQFDHKSSPQKWL